MSYITLYRKYRPQAFSEVIGQEHVTTTLKNAVDNDKVAHAYLFCGPRGTGKTSTAKILAKAVNCLKGPTSAPCGKCSNCLSITEGNSIDVIEIDAASNRGIDEIRDLREKVNFAPVNCAKKVYIIDEVHMLTTEASNALLKITEEPPGHVIFILATTEPHKVLPTITSRCQRFDFKRITVDETTNHLKKIAGNEKINIDETCLDLIAKQSQGSVRDAIGILDQLGSYSPKKVKEEDVLSLLNIYEDDLLFDFAECIIERQTAKALKLAAQVIDSGRDLPHFVNSLIEHFREIFLLITDNELEKIIARSRQSIEMLKEQSSQMELWEALKAIDLLSECSSDMRWSSDARLLFEIVLVKLTKLDADPSLEGLLYRLEEVEKRIEKKDTGSEMRDTGEKKENGLRSAYNEAKKNPESRTPNPDTLKGPKPETQITQSIQKIERLWPVILEQVKKQSIPVYALLLQCHPVSVKEKVIELEFNDGAEFHLKEVEKDDNQQVISKALSQVMGNDYKVRCVMGNGDQVASSKPKPQDKKSEDKMSPEHTVKFLKDTFGAEIVEESKFTEGEG